MPSINIAAIEKFIALVKVASRTHAPEVRLSLSDATEVTAEIAVVMAHLATVENSTSVAADGGTLR